MHIWPFLISLVPMTLRTLAASTLSGARMAGHLPPSSRVTGTRFSAAATGDLAADRPGCRCTAGDPSAGSGTPWPARCRRRTPPPGPRRTSRDTIRRSRARASGRVIRGLDDDPVAGREHLRPAARRTGRTESSTGRCCRPRPWAGTGCPARARAVERRVGGPLFLGHPGAEVLDRVGRAAGDAQHLDQVGEQVRVRAEILPHRRPDRVAVAEHHRGQGRRARSWRACGGGIGVGRERRPLEGVQPVQLGDRRAVVGDGGGGRRVGVIRGVVMESLPWRCYI